MYPFPEHSGTDLGALTRDSIRTSMTHSESRSISHILQSPRNAIRHVARNEADGCLRTPHCAACPPGDMRSSAKQKPERLHPHASRTGVVTTGNVPRDAARLTLARMALPVPEYGNYGEWVGSARQWGAGRAGATVRNRPAPPPQPIALDLHSFQTFLVNKRPYAFLYRATTLDASPCIVTPRW